MDYNFAQNAESRLHINQLVMRASRNTVPLAINFILIKLMNRN